MFCSTGNNFGSDTILFKDVQESNYLVLNAKFTYDPTNEAYKSASVLEIYVPDLTIERSTETPVAVKFTDRKASGTSTVNSDGGTFAKSWIKDWNTICIEKITQLEELGEITVYIQSLYCQLAQSSIATTLLKKSVTATTDGSYLTINTSYCFSMITPKWIFLHFSPTGSSYDYRSSDWEALLSNVPDDITSDIPVFAGRNSGHEVFGLVGGSRLEEGWWSMPVSDRPSGYINSSSVPFIYAFLVRDVDDTEDAEGRLRIAEDPLKGGGTVRMTDFDLELVPSPAFAAVAGVTGQYGKTYAHLYPQEVPETMPAFTSVLLSSLPATTSLGIQMVRMKVFDLATAPEIDFDSLSLEKNLTITLFDTSVAMAL